MAANELIAMRQSLLNAAEALGPEGAYALFSELAAQFKPSRTSKTDRARQMLREHQDWSDAKVAVELDCGTGTVYHARKLLSSETEPAPAKPAKKAPVSA